MQTSIKRALTGAAVVAVAASGLAAAPANAASGPTPYTCEVPILGPTTFQASFDTDLPDQIYAGTGQEMTFSGSVTVPDNIIGLAYGLLGARTVHGTAAGEVTYRANKHAMETQIPSTTLPNPAAPVDLPVSQQISDKLWTPGPAAVTIGEFSTDLVFVKEDGSEVPFEGIACAPVSGEPTVADRIQVVKSPTTANLDSWYAKRHRQIKAVARVRSESGLVSRGKVAFVVKKAGRVVRRATVDTRRSKAKAVFNNIRRGRYVVIARYSGSQQLERSSSRTVLRVR